MGRPPTPIARPACPLNHVGTVRLHGVRYRADHQAAKPRFLCVPATGNRDDIHTFTLGKTWHTHAHPDGTTCVQCEREVGRADGSTVVPQSSFALLEAARLLVDVGGGLSLRKSSRRLRTESGRKSVDVVGREFYSKQNALAADYLDLYGPLVTAGLRPSGWPRILVLDSLPLEMRIRQPDQLRLDLADGTYGGAILVAAGRRDLADESIAWHAAFSGGESGNDWWEFLHSLPVDPAPEWVVADGAKAIRSAVLATWPDVTFFPCRYHLRERAKFAAGPLIYQDRALAPALEVCLQAAHQWERLRAIAKPLGDTTLWHWIEENDALVRSLDGLRRHLPGAPEGNGAAESVALELRQRIGGRKSNFTNARRLNTVVELMRADIAGLARTVSYARVIRNAVADWNWKLGAGKDGFWEQAHDPFQVASVASRVAASREQAKLDFREVLVESQTKSVMAKVAADNVVREAAGLPALLATVAPGARVASVKVRGTWLRDYPELLNDWDASNDEDPLLLTAGSSYRALWTCAACGHQWRVPVCQRTMRRTRCAVCHRPWGIPATSLAATHPELVKREWVREANLPRLPEVISAKAARTAIWRCRDFPGLHPDYPMSPRARVKVEVGCPVCRSILSAARRRHRSHPDDPRLTARE